MEKNTNKVNDDHLYFIPELQPGEKLYHYTTASGVKGICEGEFWITESNFLNDKTEFRVASSIFGQIIDEYIKSRKAAERIKNKVLGEVEFYHQVGEIHDSSVAYFGDYVLSFSLDYDSALMWSEYSDFSGYCMTFSFDKLQEAFPNSRSITHGKVIYDTQTQKDSMIKSLERRIFNSDEFPFLNSWEDFTILSDEDLKDCYSQIALNVDIYNSFYKTECFSGEKEYRFVFSCGHDGGRYKPEELQKQFFRIKDGVLIPYIKTRFNPTDCIDEILIGPKQNSDIALLGLQYFLRNLKLDIEINKSDMPLRY